MARPEGSEVHAMLLWGLIVPAAGHCDQLLSLDAVDEQRGIWSVHSPVGVP